MRKLVLAAGALIAGTTLTLTACDYDYGGNEQLRFNEGEVKVGAGDLEKLNAEDAKKQNPEKKEEEKKVEKPADVGVEGNVVNNLRQEKARNAKNFCASSKLPAGEGKDDKGGTCVSTQLGEIAKNPVLVAMPNFPSVVEAGKNFEVKVQIEDKFGALDLNAFTHDENFKAGDTFLEHPSELDEKGRPFLHAHIGVTSLKSKQGLPETNDYNAAFSGVQGVKGEDIKVQLGGLEKGFYRADVYAGGPGHAPNPTAKANQVQAFASVYFEVK